MISSVLGAVRRVWHTLDIAEPMPDHMHYVLQSRNRVVFFLFAGDHLDYPLVVVKLSRDPAQNHLLKRSVERAQHVRTLLDDDMQATIPTMSLLEPISGLAGVVEKALPGQPLEVATIGGSHEMIVANGCRAFADWLARFQACTQSGLFEVSRTWLESTLHQTLEELPGICDTDKSVVKRSLATLAGLQVPLVWAYGDAHPSNILLESGKVSGVVDWEGTAPGQWAVFDWFQFILSLAQELVKPQFSGDRLQPAIVACRLLMRQPETRLATVLQNQTARFFSLVGLDTELTFPLFLVFLLHYFWFDDRESLIQRVLVEL